MVNELPRLGALRTFKVSPIHHHGLDPTLARIMYVLLAGEPRNVRSGMPTAIHDTLYNNIDIPYTPYIFAGQFLVYAILHIIASLPCDYCVNILRPTWLYKQLVFLFPRPLGHNHTILIVHCAGIRFLDRIRALVTRANLRLIYTYTLTCTM